MPTQEEFNAVLDKLYSKLGEGRLRGEAPPLAGEAQQMLKTDLGQIGLPVSDELSSAMVGQLMPGLDLGVIETAKQIAAPVGEGALDLIGMLNKGVLNPMGATEAVINKYGTMTDAVSALLAETIGTPKTNLGDTMGSQIFEPLRQSTDAVIDTAKEAITPAYKVQDPYGRAGQAILHGAAKYVPLAVAAVSSGKLGELPKLGAESGKILTEAVTGTGIGARALRYASEVFGEEAGFGIALATATVALDDKVAKGLVSGDLKGAATLMANEFTEQALIGGAVGLGLRAVFKPFGKLIWKNQDIANSVTDISTPPPLLDQLTNNQLYVTKDDLVNIQGIDAGLNALKAAAKAGDQEAQALAMSQLSMAGPEQLKNAMRVKANQIESLYHNIFEQRLEGELDTLGSMAKVWIRNDEFGAPSASKFYFDAEMRVQELRSDVSRLQEMAPIDKETYTALQSGLDDIQREFNTIRQEMEPGIRRLLEKNYRGEKLLPDEQAMFDAALKIEKLQSGLMDPDVSNPAMAKMREILIPEIINNDMMVLSSAKGGVEQIRLLPSYAEGMTNLVETAKKLDVEGIVQLLGSKEGRFLHWSTLFGKLNELQPGTVSKLLELRDPEQLLNGFKDLIRSEFLGKKAELVGYLSKQEGFAQGLDAQASYSTTFQQALIKKFPGTFGDVSPTAKGGENAFKAIRMGLDYGMGVDASVAKDMMQVMKNNLDYLKKNNLIEPDAVRNYEMALDFYDTLNGAIFKGTGYRPAPLLRATETADAGLQGSINRATGLVTLFTHGHILDGMSATARNEMITAGIHEMSHGIIFALPGEVKAAYFKALMEVRKSGKGNWSWMYPVKDGRVPKYMLESSHETMAEVLTRAVMARMKNDPQMFREVIRAIPLTARTAFQQTMNDLAKSIERSPFAQTAMNAILKKFQETAQVMRMEADPFYAKIMKQVEAQATAPERTLLQYRNQVWQADADVLRHILPAKNGFDSTGKLTPEGAQFLNTELYSKFEAGTEMADVVDYVAKTAIERAQTIKLSAPEGTPDPIELYMSAQRLIADLRERITAPGDVGVYYQQSYGPKVGEFLDQLSSDVRKLGGFWVKEDMGAAMGSLADLQRYHSTLQNLVNNGRGQNPRLWDSMDSSFVGSYLSKQLRALRSTEFFKRHFPDVMTKDLGNLHAMGLTPQYLAKRHPVLGAIADLWRTAAMKKQETIGKILQNDGNILGDATVKPIMRYLDLANNSFKKYMRPGQFESEVRVRDAVNKLLLVGNDIANQTGGRGSTRDWGKVARNAHGSITDRALVDNVLLNDTIFGYGPMQLTREEMNLAYDMYRGVNSTMHFMRDQSMKSMEIRQANISPSEDIAKMRLDMTALVGSIPQARRGDHAIVVKLKGGKHYTQFFEAGPFSSAGNMLGDMLSKKPANGMAWARDVIEKLRTEGSTEWGINGADVLDAKIYKRAELPKDVYFGAKPTNLQMILNQAADRLGKGENPIGDEAIAELRKALTSELVDMTRGGGFLSHSKFRQNVPGWDTVNLQQTMREYIDQFAGYQTRSTAMEHSLEAIKLLAEQPKLYHYANTLISDMTSGFDKMAKVANTIKTLSYWHYMAFKVSTAVMQITQNFMMGVPRLGMEGVDRAGRRIVRAMREISKVMGQEYVAAYKTGYRGFNTEELMARGFNALDARALHEAQLSGVTWANFTKQFMETDNSATKSLMSSMIETSALPLRMMEELNRRSIFLVGFRHNLEKLAQEPAGKYTAEEIYRTAFERATRISNDAHIIYDRTNLPSWARRPDLIGAVGRGAYALKNFSHGYMQFLGWMMKEDKSWANVGKAFGFLLGAGGVTAIPMFDSFAKLFGDKDGVEWRERLEGSVGQGAAQFIINGPLGNWTNFGERLNPVSSSLFSTTMGGMWDDGKKALNLLQRGDYLGAFAQSPLSPAGFTAVHDAGQAYEVGKLTKSGKLMSLDGKPIKYSFEDALTKAFGFTPYNAGMTQWYRERAKDAYWNDKKALMAEKVRNDFTKSGAISPETVKEFHLLRMQTSRAGRPMSVTNPMKIVGNKRLLEDY